MMRQGLRHITLVALVSATAAKVSFVTPVIGSNLIYTKGTPTEVAWTDSYSGVYIDLVNANYNTDPEVIAIINTIAVVGTSLTWTPSTHISANAYRYELYDGQFTIFSEVFHIIDASVSSSTTTSPSSSRSTYDASGYLTATTLATTVSSTPTCTEQ